jgi:cytochrome P450
MAAANRGPERLPDPDGFDIARKDNRHLAFGYTDHLCFAAGHSHLGLEWPILHQEFRLLRNFNIMTPPGQAITPPFAKRAKRVCEQDSTRAH